MSEQPTSKDAGTADDLYAGFAARYDTFFEVEGDPGAQVAFFDTIFKKHSVNRVLDCSCGTGEHLKMLSSLGLSLFGSDISPAMLAVAKEKMERLGLKIPLVKADFRSLPEHFPEPFDAILCLSTSLPHVETEEEMIRAIKSMHASLTDGGMLILTQGSSDRMMTEKPRFIPVVNNRDLSRAFVIDYHGRGMTFHVLDFIHTDQQTEFVSWSASYPYMPLEEDYRRMLAAGGFQKVHTYGGYDFSPYGETSEFLIIVGEKEPS
jgi:SAM-dependent methyltransferase